MSRAVTLAVCGKGGVGKTTVAALMVRALAEKGDQKVLAIDADPAIGLSYALGIDVARTVDDIRNDLIEKISRGNIDDKADTLRMLDYDIFSALSEHKRFALLAIGRPEGEGCYCEVNQLLKEIIESLSSSFDIIVIDGEAGLEQINRRVMKNVDHLILVSDTSAKGLNVAKVIRNVADNSSVVHYSKIGLLLNRIKAREEVDNIMEGVGLDFLGWIPEDSMVREYDFEGKSYLNFPNASPVSQAVAGMLVSIGI